MGVCTLLEYNNATNCSCQWARWVGRRGVAGSTATLEVLQFWMPTTSPNLAPVPHTGHPKMEEYTLSGSLKMIRWWPAPKFSTRHRDGIHFSRMTFTSFTRRTALCLPAVSCLNTFKLLQWCRDLTDSSLIHYISLINSNSTVYPVHWMRLSPVGKNVWS